MYISRWRMRYWRAKAFIGKLLEHKAFKPLCLLGYHSFKILRSKGLLNPKIVAFNGGVNVGDFMPQYPIWLRSKYCRRCGYQVYWHEVDHK